MKCLAVVAALVPALCAVAWPAPPRAAPAQDESTRAAARFDHEHAEWTRIVRIHVRGGRCDYPALAGQRAGFDRYLESLAKVKVEEFQTWERPQRYAFWINVYNAWTIRRVIDAWPANAVEGRPVKSIKDLGDEKVSVWDRELIPLAHLAPELERKQLSLNDVEHRILRKQFEDARLHAAINCAALSCPRLREEAYTAAKLDAQLDDQVRGWLADTALNRFDRANKRVELSKLFYWFAPDFAGDGGALAWIARFRPDDADWLTANDAPLVVYFEYDWAINTVIRPEREADK